VRVLLTPSGTIAAEVPSAAAVGSDPLGADEHEALVALYETPGDLPHDRPWLVANMVSGLDGSLTHGGRVGVLSSALDRRLFVHLRGLADAVVVGAGTARAEDYGPVRLPADVERGRSRAGRSPVPPLVVVSRSLELDPAARLFQGDPPTIVLTSRSSPPVRRNALREVADVVEAGDDAVDLVEGMRALRDRGIAVAVTEGGPTLLAELVDGDLLDELCLTLAPVLGGDPVTMAVPTLLPRPLTRWGLASVAEADGELYLRYTRQERP
jgi:riboflavin biosynthesis pyrimidine reductase